MIVIANHSTGTKGGVKQSGFETYKLRLLRTSANATTRARNDQKINN